MLDSANPQYEIRKRSEAFVAMRPFNRFNNFNNLTNGSELRDLACYE
jgi:hypothetical protein